MRNMNWGGRTRTSNFPVNSRAVCQLTYTPRHRNHPTHREQPLGTRRTGAQRLTGMRGQEHLRPRGAGGAFTNLPCHYAARPTCRLRLRFETTTANVNMGQQYNRLVPQARDPSPTHTVTRTSNQAPFLAWDSTAAAMNLTPRAPSSTVGTSIAWGSAARLARRARICSAKSR